MPRLKINIHFFWKISHIGRHLITRIAIMDDSYIILFFYGVTKMSIKIGRYNFEGPYSSSDSLQDKSGVYVILCENGSGYGPIDCGESATVKSRIESHDRRNCWNRNCNGSLRFSVLYTPNIQSAGRVAIEQEIRQNYNFPCGKY